MAIWGTSRSFRIRALAALSAIAVPAALAPVGASADHRPENFLFKLSGAANQNVLGAGAVKILARCPNEACTVVASATSESPSVHSAKVSARLPSGSSERLAVPLTKRERGKLKAAFQNGHPPTLTVEAIARDSAGNKVPLSFEVRVRKP